MDLSERNSLTDVGSQKQPSVVISQSYQTRLNCQMTNSNYRFVLYNDTNLCSVLKRDILLALCQYPSADFYLINTNILRRKSIQRYVIHGNMTPSMCSVINVV